MTTVTENEIKSRHHQLDFFYIDYIRNGRTFEGIQLQQYSILQMIGQGAFAQIYRGVNETQRKQVAIKVLNLRTVQSQRNIKLREIKKRLIEQESKIMMKFDSPHILKCYQCYQNKDFKIMVLQYCNQGSLQDKIYEHGHIPENQAVYIIKQIINGIGECHRQRIIHRDLKPDNILIHNGEYKIADFGFSKMLNIQNQQEITMNTRLGTMITMAPQVLKGQKYGLKADIWSIGVIFFHMLFGQCPFKSDSAIEMVAQITNTRLLTQKQYKGIRISQNARKFLREVLVVDIQKRLGWKELLNHELFSVQGSKLGDMFERNYEIKQRDEQLQKLSRQFVIENMDDKKLFEYIQQESESLINFQNSLSEKEKENIKPANLYENKKLGQQKQLPEKENQKYTHFVQNAQGRIGQDELLRSIQNKANRNYLDLEISTKPEKKVCNLDQSSKFRQSQFLENEKQQQVFDRSQSQHRKLTPQQRLKIQNSINRQQTQIYKWAQRIYIECKKTEVIYNKIIKPIEDLKLLNLAQRRNIEFMYLVSTRCLNNMSPINDAYNKRKNNTIIQELKDKVESLYQKVLKKWTKYSQLLTSKENQFAVIISDWFSKKLQKQKIKKKDKYLSGIENMLDFKGIQQPAQNAQFRDYEKTQQIAFTLEYIEEVLKQLMEKQESKQVKIHLNHYKEICLIDFNDLRKRTFDQYINLVLK